MISPMKCKLSPDINLNMKDMNVSYKMVIKLENKVKAKLLKIAFSHSHSLKFHSP